MSDHTVYKTIDGEICTIPPIKDICKCLEIKFKDLSNQAAYWQDRFENLTKSDKEYQVLKEERDTAKADLFRGFGITEEEDKRIQDWLKEHKKTHLRGLGVSYVFTPTSLGTAGKIKCSCGEEFTFRELG